MEVICQKIKPTLMITKLKNIDLLTPQNSVLAQNGGNGDDAINIFWANSYESFKGEPHYQYGFLQGPSMYLWLSPECIHILHSHLVLAIRAIFKKNWVPLTLKYLFLFCFRAPPAPKGRKYIVIIYSINIYWMQTYLGTGDTASTS